LTPASAQRHAANEEETVNWIVANIKWIMLLAGALTCTMLYAAIAPQSALRSTFGESLEGPVAEIVVRSWGALIFLVGAMLLYGAYHPPVRALVLTVAGASKAFFIALILAQGSRFLQPAGVTLVVDSVMVLLFIAYLAGARRGRSAV
jgi:hypothetical protein